MSKSSASPKPHEVYAFTLQNLPLTDEHRRQLNNRGLSDEEIAKFGYASLPTSRAEVMSKLLDKWPDGLSGVAGFWCDDKGEWRLAGKNGILIPIRDKEGKITAMKVRLDKPATPSQKYLLLSSNPKADRKTGTQKYPGGTAAKAAVHFPLGLPKKLKTLRITEGEIKADVASSITEYTVAIPGVAMWKLAVDVIKELKPEEVLICFDSDKGEARIIESQDDLAYGQKREDVGFRNVQAEETEDFFIGKALSSFYLALEKEGVNVFIETWEEEFGKGIDDVIMGGNPEAIRRMTKEEAAEFCHEMLSKGVPEDWVYVIGTKRFIHSRKLLEWDKEQYDDCYRAEVDGTPSNLALDNAAFPKADIPIYMPQAPVLYRDAEGRRIFNFWRPNDLVPVQGDIKPFLAHCQYIIPDEAERGIVLDWMAYNVQNPGKKIHWAVLIQGIQGCGKSFFGWVMRLVLGNRNVSCPSNETIHEVYTNWAKACQVAIIEEIMARGRLELMNKLKPIITEPYITIREMYKAPYEQPNVFNLMMFTNHRDAIIIDDSDRRYCVIFSPAVPKEAQYYKDLWKWSGDNSGSILDFLIKRDLSKFEPKGHAPMTAGKKEVISLSTPPLQQWMAECIDGELWPFQGDLVSTHHLASCIPSNLRNFSSPQAIGRTLAAVGAKQLQQVPLTNGSRVRLWAVRRQATWENEGPKALVQAFEKWAAKSEPGGRVEDYNPLRDSKPM